MIPARPARTICQEDGEVIKKPRFEVIGVGPWGELHARALSRCADAELAAICDVHESRARVVMANTGAKCIL